MHLRFAIKQSPTWDKKCAGCMMRSKSLTELMTARGLRRLFIEPPIAPATLDPFKWWANLACVHDTTVPNHVDRAVLTGYHASTISQAFTGAYQLALGAMGLRKHCQKHELAAFCVTEKGGNRAEDMKTTIFTKEVGWATVDVLHGTKTFASLVPGASVVYIVAMVDKWPQPNVGRPELGAQSVLAVELPWRRGRHGWPDDWRVLVQILLRIGISYHFSWP
jgi:hypothetical protein